MEPNNTKNWILIDTKGVENLKTIEVYLMGDLDILQDLEGFKGCLSDCIQKYEQIIIRSKENFQADIAFIQLMFSFIKSAHEKKKPVKIELTFEERTKELVEKAGLSNFSDLL